MHANGSVYLILDPGLKPGGLNTGKKSHVRAGYLKKTDLTNIWVYLPIHQSIRK